MTTGHSHDEIREHDRPELSTSWWERLVALIGLILALSAIGYLLYQAISSKDSPPAIELRVDEILTTQNSYLVKITALNQSDSTAAELKLAGTLFQDEEPVETSQITFDYLPAQSQRKGGLFFQYDPRRYRLRLRAEGYQNP